jgi:hypothetical protein
MKSILNVLVGVDPASQIMAGVAPTPLKRVALDLSKMSVPQRRTLIAHLWNEDASIRARLSPDCPPIVLQHPATMDTVVAWLEARAFNTHGDAA